MIGNLSMTLYDVFGYFVPGMVCLAAVLTITWSLFFPKVPLALETPTTYIQVVALFVAYILGHMIQAIGNLVDQLVRGKSRATKMMENEFESSVLDVAKAKAAQMAGIPVLCVSCDLLHTIADTVALQEGFTQEREVFQYRKGLYRGLVVSTAFLGIAILVRLIIPTAMIELPSQSEIPLSNTFLVLLITSCLVTAFLSYLRFMRFQKYRITRTIIAFLITAERTSSRRSQEAEHA